MKEKKYRITFLDKTLNTNHYYPLDDVECNNIREKYYEKPHITLVEQNFINIYNQKHNVSHIIDYYLSTLIDKVKLNSAKWSVEDVLKCNDLIRYFYSRVKSNEKVYPPTLPFIKNFKTAIRISGGGVAMKASNFPIQIVDKIIKKYNINNNFYDFSCGWAIRMLSAMRNNVNYYGTDPNYLLINKLKRIHKDYNRINKTNVYINIKCLGSEIFIPEWENKMGLIFSSPPYYILEDYKIGKQSIKNKTYKEWLDSYFLVTIQNCTKYLIKNGFFLINIKNISGFNLYDDTKKIIENTNQLTYIGYEILTNIKRPCANKNNFNTDEKIMIFTKS